MSCLSQQSINHNSVHPICAWGDWTTCGLGALAYNSPFGASPSTREEENVDERHQ